MSMQIQTSEIERERRLALTRITGCRSPTHCGSLCLQSSSLLHPGERGWEWTDVREVNWDYGYKQISTVLVSH